MTSVKSRSSIRSLNTLGSGPDSELVISKMGKFSNEWLNCGGTVTFQRSQEVDSNNTIFIFSNSVVKSEA